MLHHCSLNSSVIFILWYIGLQAKEHAYACCGFSMPQRQTDLSWSHPPGLCPFFQPDLACLQESCAHLFHLDNEEWLQLIQSKSKYKCYIPLAPLLNLLNSLESTHLVWTKVQLGKHETVSLRKTIVSGATEMFHFQIIFAWTLFLILNSYILYYHNGR